MINLRFLMKRMKGANYKGFIDSAKRISKINHKPWPVNLADCLMCTALYGSGYVDYETFEMYNMNSRERANVLTISKNNDLYKQLNDPRYIHYFTDKSEFNKKFSKYLKRDWFYLKDHTYEEYLDFIKDKDRIIAKPLDLSCGQGIHMYNVKKHDPKALYNALMKRRAFLIEEVVEQSDEMASLCASSVNTIRLITIRNGNDVSIVAGCVRMSRGDKVVDNFNNGGLAAILNTNTGKLETDGYDKWRHNYIRHPATGTVIKGFPIPDWEEVQQTVREAALVVPQVRYIGWDVAISKKYGPLLIEGNDFPGQDLTQYPKLNLGTYGVMKAAIRE